MNAGGIVGFFPFGVFYFNATQENIAKMFKDAKEKALTIIFINEINKLVPNRESNVHEMSRSAEQNARTDG